LLDIKGRVLILGDHISTDQIISTKYMLLNSNSEMAKHAFEAISEDFSSKVNGGDIIVAGFNFGCGSAREQAPEVLKELGIGAIIAKSFNSTFYRNAINIGLPAFIPESLEYEIDNGDDIHILISENRVLNKTKNNMMELKPVSDIIKDILDCSGLVNYYNKVRNNYEF